MDQIWCACGNSLKCDGPCRSANLNRKRETGATCPAAFSGDQNRKPEKRDRSKIAERVRRTKNEKFSRGDKHGLDRR